MIGIITLLLNWLFNVTINDISVIYVTAHRCAGGLKKKLDLLSGSQRHRHFVGFFNVLVLAPTRDHPFYTVIRHTAPFSRLLRSRWGYGGAHSRLNPPGPHGGGGYNNKVIHRINYNVTFVYSSRTHLTLNLGVVPMGFFSEISPSLHVQ